MEESSRAFICSAAEGPPAAAFPSAAGSSSRGISPVPVGVPRPAAAAAPAAPAPAAGRPPRASSPSQPSCCRLDPACCCSTLEPVEERCLLRACLLLLGPEAEVANAVVLMRRACSRSSSKGGQRGWQHQWHVAPQGLTKISITTHGSKGSHCSIKAKPPTGGCVCSTSHAANASLLTSGSGGVGSALCSYMSRCCKAQMSYALAVSSRAFTGPTEALPMSSPCASLMRFSSSLFLLVTCLPTGIKHEQWAGEGFVITAKSFPSSPGAAVAKEGSARASSSGPG